MRKMEKKMATFMEQANKKLEGSGFGLKAVFVTFNTESQADACMAACPRGELQCTKAGLLGVQMCSVRSQHRSAGTSPSIGMLN
jgi:hypothetical protein